MASLLKKIYGKFSDQLSGTASSDIEEAGRRNLFSIFLLLLIAPLLIFGTYLIKSGYYGYGIVDYIVAALFVTFLFIFRKVRNAKVFYRFALSLLCFLMVYWVNTGAAKGYASIWVLTIPPFTFFLLGKKEGVIWTIFVFGVTAAFFFFPALSVNGFVYETGFVSRYLFALFLIVLFTYNYESVRERYKTAMEGEQRKLLEEKERLAAAKNEVEAVNAKLSEEMRIRRKAEEDLRSHRDRLEEIVVERTLELRNSNAMLAANEKKYRLMADNITDMIWTADMNLHFTFISPSVSRIFGYTVEEAMNLPFDKWNTPDSFGKVIQSFHEQIELEKEGGADPDRYVNVELEHIRKDGTVIPVEVTVSFLRNSRGEAVGIVGITRDISERIKAQDENRRMHEQLAQSQKMEAIGTLVSGIAHDFNNILGGIIGSFDLLTRMLKDEKLEKRERVDKYLNLGMESSLRSAELIKQLLALSRKHEITLTPVDINESLGHVIEICRNSLPKTVQIDYVPSDVPLVVMGDIIQVEQVFLNLCINASHAMTIMRGGDEKTGGVLKLRACKVHSDYIIKELYPECNSYDGTWVKVEVSDTGVGMDNETRKRIFEPFFSMKKQNEGSGLGLAISYNIIRQHRGLIHIYSEPGKGSSFSVYIPSYENVEAIGKNRKSSGDISMGSGTVLVIDDEHVMLNVAKGFLEECGYNVITADNGDEGINIYRRRCSDISAVIVDLSMPGKSGLEVFIELKNLNRDVKVILASGMLDQESRLTADTIGIKGVVNKPYLANELSQMLKSIIQ
ncbi:MAG TPA: PAS domain S-box protein [Spirochaetota bacterium]|nr:PAS domain S-box protein [Spirochaetota bacterium]HPR38972.1 PAS domain S-box protein [Spirochaetota bacterium]